MAESFVSRRLVRVRTVVAALVAALALVGSTGVTPALATPDHNVVVDFGTTRLAGVIVCLDNGVQGCGEQFEVDATGVARTTLPVGTYVMCVPTTDYLWELCGNAPASQRTIRVTSTETVTTYRFRLRDKTTDPASAAVGAMTWAATKTAGEWSYGWSYDVAYSFAPSVASPWIRSRLLAQTGDVLFDTGKERVARGSGAYTWSAGGGSSSTCGFVWREKTGRIVPVASLTLEVTAPVPGGTRTYRARAATNLEGCGKPPTLAYGSVRLAGAQVGRTARATVVTWPGLTPSYQWYLDGKKITGATRSTIAVRASAVSKTLEARATVRGSGYRTTTRPALATVRKGNLGTLARPRVTGTVKVGRTLKATVTTRVTGASYRYQWYADGKRISGATASKLRLRSAQAGKRITVAVTYTKKGYVTKRATSVRTSPVRR